MTPSMDPKTWISLEGRVALVTGGCRGVGAMIAEGFVAVGARVYITSRSADQCAETARRLAGYPGECIALPGDVSTSEGLDAIASSLIEREPELHVLVNNAGIVRSGHLDEFPMADWDDVMAVNFRAPFFLTQRLAGLLRAGATPERHTAVINVSSITATKTGRLRDYPYRASKAGLNQMTRMLGRDLGEDNITVNAVAPGFFRSAMTEFMLDNQALYDRFIATNPIPRPGRVEEIAALFVYLASPVGGYVTGSVFEIDGGLRFVN